MPPDTILAAIPDFVRRRRLAPIGGLPERPAGYFTGRPVARIAPVQDALAALSQAGLGFFAADRAVLMAGGRHAILVRRLAPGPSALLRRAFGDGHALLDALDAAGTPDGDVLDGETPSAHRRIHLAGLLAAAPPAARAAWARIADVRPARPPGPLPPLRFRREGRFRWIAEDGQSLPWLLREIPEAP